MTEPHVEAQAFLTLEDARKLGIEITTTDVLAAMFRLGEPVSDELVAHFSREFFENGIDVRDIETARAPEYDSPGLRFLLERWSGRAAR